MTNSNFIKSPLNYVGGKHRLLSQIMPLFPEKIGTFVDLFAGGGNVAVNVDADLIIMNDVQKEVINLLTYFYGRDVAALLKEIDETVDYYGLSKENREGYLKLREDYNKFKSNPTLLYALITHSFNNQIRFNLSREFNMPFGKNRSHFNPRLRKRFGEFVNKMQEKTITFRSTDFRQFNFEEFGELNENDLVYCDPPYLITTATYNESGGWTKEDEIELYKSLDELNNSGIKFAISNVLEHKGKSNNILMEWASSYNIHELSVSYANSNYQRTDRDKVSREVLITNY